MMFSTKAEYGVRVMVELARGRADEPVPLAEIAQRDGLPLAYLEHLVARLRRAGLVDSRRGSRGGYLLARAPQEITMAEVVEALEGSIAPIECISQSDDGTIVCSRESDAAHVCPTKLLWTRVRMSIVRALQETTLADLAKAAHAGPAVASLDGARSRDGAGAPAQPAPGAARAAGRRSSARSAASGRPGPAPMSA